jgi:3-oxoacyl-[acyl-carrier-protein] synthase III
VVVGGDKMSSIIDYEDRATCIIFGDGCGAVLLEPTRGTVLGDGQHPAQRWQRLPIPAPESRRLHASGH